MDRYQFTIVGETPLLMHANNIDARDDIEARRKKLRNGKAGDDRTPPETWKGYLYVSGDPDSDEPRLLCIPTENLLACLLHGGAKVKLKGKETLKQHTQRLMFDEIDYPLVVNGGTVNVDDLEKIDSPEFKDHSDAVRQYGFRLSVKPCTVGTSSHVRVRPMFPTWAITGTFGVAPEDASIFTLSTLQDLWTAAGRLSGLGDWRPSSPKRPGQYGRFSAVIKKI